MTKCLPKVPCLTLLSPKRWKVLYESASIYLSIYGTDCGRRMYCTFPPNWQHQLASEAVLTRGAAAVRYTTPDKQMRSREEKAIVCPVQPVSEPLLAARGQWASGFYMLPCCFKTGYLSGAHMTLSLLILISKQSSCAALPPIGLSQKFMALLHVQGRTV